jgi:hypothetical protein
LAACDGGSGVHCAGAGADGKRFLISTAPGADAELPPLTVVVNWLAGVKK